MKKIFLAPDLSLETLSLARIPRNTVRKLRCNICERVYRARTRFQRFCRDCKETSELFRFYESSPVG